MADHYTEFSTVLLMPTEKAQQLKADLLRRSDIGEAFLGSTDDSGKQIEPLHMPDIYEVTKDGDKGLWIAGHYGLDDEVVEFISEWLHVNVPDFTPQVINFANYCSKLSVDEQSGFALKLSAGKVEYGTMRFG